MSDLLGLLGITEDQARVFVDACEDGSLARTPAVSKIAAAIRAALPFAEPPVGSLAQDDNWTWFRFGDGHTHWMGAHGWARMPLLGATCSWRELSGRDGLRIIPSEAAGEALNDMFDRHAR